MKNLSRNPSTKSISGTKISPYFKQLYFCHFKNGMYMGSMECFQKDKLGLVLHDNGSSMLSSYSKDMLHGDNVVFYANGACLSARYVKDKLTQLVYKNKDVIFFSNYKNNFPDGGAILIRLAQQVIQYLYYKNGVISSKSNQEDRGKLTKIFVHKSYEELIPKQHIKNIELEGTVHNEISICKKSGKILIGFTKEDYMINGLGFVLLIKETEDVDIEVLQRGYYKNSQLSGFGQRNFKNGNNYIGEFRYDQFEGKGVLKNIHKHNWVSGNFERGSLVQLLTYGNEGDEKAANKVLESIHQQKMSWVNKDLVVPSQEAIERQISLIFKQKVSVDHHFFHRKQSQVLRKIQDNFITSGQQASGQISSSGSRKISIVHRKNSKQHSPNSSVQQYQQYDSYSFIKQNQPDLSSQSRRHIFDMSQNSSSRNKSSFRLDLRPVPMDTPKQIQSRLVMKSPTPLKKTPSSRMIQKTPPKQKPTTKASNTQNKNSNSKSVSRSKSSSNIKTLNLIDSIYKKNTKNKLF